MQPLKSVTTAHFPSWAMPSITTMPEKITVTLWHGLGRRVQSAPRDSQTKRHWTSIATESIATRNMCVISVAKNTSASTGTSYTPTRSTRTLFGTRGSNARLASYVIQVGCLKSEVIQISYFCDYILDLKTLENHQQSAHLEDTYNYFHSESATEVCNFCLTPCSSKANYYQVNWYLE